MPRSLFNILVDIIYPKACLACKSKLQDKTSVDDIVCAECWGRIKKNAPPFCHSCGRHLDKFINNICPNCVRKPPFFDRAFSPCVYEGVTKELIHAFKYKGRDYLGQTLSRLMIEFIKEYNLPIDFMDLIVPVPLHKTRLREREFNQAQVLSKHIACEFNKKMSYDNLRRLRNTKTQTELEIVDRMLNVKGCFSVTNKEEIKGKNILLIDDVITTSATSSEAAYTLKNCGANIVFVLAIAN